MYDLSDSRAMLPVLIVLYFSNNNNESLSNEARVTSLTTGVCTAPNTCTCPREWSGYNCSYPVCEQGKFLKNGNSALDTDAKDGKNLILLMKMEWSMERHCCRSFETFVPTSPPNGTAL